MRKELYLSGLFIFVFIFIQNSLQAQISQGGMPLKVVVEKSVSKKAWVVLPAVPEAAIEQAKVQNEQAKVGLKPFRFAHPFEVNYSPSNSGVWLMTDSGYNVWQLTIRSEGAYSLNVIFEDFKLPAGARLFLYNEKESSFLGAYTQVNNKKGGKFAVSPVRGDQLTIQYEVPEELGTPNSFTVRRVNHDFVGIVKSDRRPLGELAEDCNVDVNCNVGARFSDLKDAVCRIIVDGQEICSGTLINNAEEDKKPYVISAAHCYDSWSLAQTTVFAFNYESPYCAPLDGDPVHTISGAEMKAWAQDLDISLVEMSMVPPPAFHPYYAGWDRSETLGDTVVSIHHPKGDIKKMSLSYTKPEISDFAKGYTPNGFLHIKHWDVGVTEIGSSGGGLFNTNDQLLGTLTGGAAYCKEPYNDYYARFALAWDNYADSSRQFKHWLDPLNSGKMSVPARRFYEGADLCAAFTHLTDTDEHGLVKLTSGGVFKGYWGGTNDVGITGFMEKFSILGNESLAGVSLGMGKISADNGSMNSRITVKVYNGTNGPEQLIYSKQVDISQLAEDAMNFIAFDEDVSPASTFFVGFELSAVHSLDTFVVYQSLREGSEGNYFYYQRDGKWYSFKEQSQQSMVMAMELLACNVDPSVIGDSSDWELPEKVWLYPNPTNGVVSVESDQDIMMEAVKVYNMLGQDINPPIESLNEFKIRIDMSGQLPGLYVVTFNYDQGRVTRKFSYSGR